MTTERHSGVGEEAMETIVAEEKPASIWSTIYTHAWFQVLLISFICFCCPGMYNALTGLGGSGQVDPTAAANANVALLSATAGSALFVAGPLFSRLGPRQSYLLGGWTYALYAGSLLCFNFTANSAFVIAAGGVLGIGASFLWVSQGAIMTSYVPEEQKGRAIAVFWIIFNLGGGIGSLASFGLNYNNEEDTVSNGTYIALMVIMVFGWVIGIFICPPSRIRLVQLREAESRAVDSEGQSIKQVALLTIRTMANWRILCVIPFFFCANVFYSYQQNEVNGKTFNLRTRSLNSALYWMAQMVGGLVMGMLLDISRLNRRQRAWLGWGFLLVTGMSIWGGGYAFQKWETKRLEAGLDHDIDYKDSSISVGPIFLYIFYGAFDAFWQSYAYWIIGTLSNSAAVTAIIVGCYKTFQATGGAMAWRINALGEPQMNQLAMNWGLSIGALILAIPTVWTVTLTSKTSGSEDNVDEKKDDDDVHKE